VNVSSASAPCGSSAIWGSNFLYTFDGDAGGGELTLVGDTGAAAGTVFVFTLQP
jgi:hypothetical protein